MIIQKKKLGYIGEEAVGKYMTEQGYKILAKNYTIRGGELDIIATKGDYIVFVEVKTRQVGSIVSGLEAISKSKQKLVVRSASTYLAKHPSDLQPRFDVADVEQYNDNITAINYIENAFDASNFFY